MTLTATYIGDGPNSPQHFKMTFRKQQCRLTFTAQFMQERRLRPKESKEINVT